MFKSLFGDLTSQRERRDHEESQIEFASTAVMDDADVDEESGSGFTPYDRHQRDLYVTGSPAVAMRTHFASLRDGRDTTQRLITLHDPAHMWAGAVIKALSDASGQPIERLHLRQQHTLEALAVIERTTLPRRADDTLKVYHADLRLDDRPVADDVKLVPLALMEASDLAAVIVGPLSPTALDELLATLFAATRGDNWRCGQLLFMLPVGAMWIAHKVDALDWPAKVQVVMLSEPLTSASAVWNKVLAHWNRVKPSAAESAAPAPSGFIPTGIAPFADTRPNAMTEAASAAAAAPTATPAPPAWRAGTGMAPLDGAQRPPDPQRAVVILRELMLLDGLIFASLIDSNTGLVVASDAQGPDIDRAAQAATEILRVHRRTLRQMGHGRPNDPVDEVLVTAGNRYHILRTLQAHPDYFILAVLDKLRSNLAMTRFRVMEAQQVLV